MDDNFRSLFKYLFSKCFLIILGELNKLFHMIFLPNEHFNLKCEMSMMYLPLFL